jgi:hypothetical protein
MMSKFEYTDTKSVRSSAVDEVFYNRDDKTLAVTLHGEVYQYDNVPKDIYNRLTGGWHSTGKVYAKEVKRNYGPGKHLGDAYSVDISEKSYEAPNMGSLATGGLITATQARSNAGVGTPKGLSLAPNAVVDGQRIDLKVNAGSAQRKHTVVFEAGGTLRSHSILAANVDAAVADLNGLADALGVKFKVKEVTVSFE